MSEAGQVRFRCSLFGKLIPQISYRASNTYYDDFYFQESVYWRDLTVEDMKLFEAPVGQRFRYRRSLFGKLILQVQHEVRYAAGLGRLAPDPLATRTLMEWRDATIEDLQDENFTEVTS
ncbi:MAG: hypothetical protein PBV01_10325 [Brucella anthropi]